MPRTATEPVQIDSLRWWEEKIRSLFRSNALAPNEAIRLAPYPLATYYLMLRAIRQSSIFLRPSKFHRRSHAGLPRGHPLLRCARSPDPARCLEGLHWQRFALIQGDPRSCLRQGRETRTEHSFALTGMKQRGTEHKELPACGLGDLYTTLFQKQLRTAKHESNHQNGRQRRSRRFRHGWCRRGNPFLPVEAQDI